MLGRPYILGIVGVPLLLVGIAVIATLPRTRGAISTSLITYSVISAERGFEDQPEKRVYHLKRSLNVPPVVKANELFDIKYGLKLVDVTYPGRPGEKEKSVSKGEVSVGGHTVSLRDFDTPLLWSSFIATVSGLHFTANSPSRRLSADGTTSWQAQFSERGKTSVHVELKTDEHTDFMETKENDPEVYVSGEFLVIRTYFGYFAAVLGSLGSMTSLIEFMRKWREDKRKRRKPRRVRKSTPTA